MAAWFGAIEAADIDFTYDERVSTLPRHQTPGATPRLRPTRPVRPNATIETSRLVGVKFTVRPSLGLCRGDPPADAEVAGVADHGLRCATPDAPHSSRLSVRGMMVEPSEVTDMDLYLMQHGQATTETEDPERPLTDAGRAAVQRVAKRARAADVRISGCLHSGKLRAEQTAQLLVREIGGEPSVEARPGLAPNDPVVPVAQWLRAETEHQSLALVGHMPFLGRLASLLVVGDEQAQVVGFQMGGLVKLEPKVDRDGFSVAWALPPDLA